MLLHLCFYTVCFYTEHNQNLTLAASAPRSATIQSSAELRNVEVMDRAKDSSFSRPDIDTTRTRSAPCDRSGVAVCYACTVENGKHCSTDQDLVAL